MPRVRIGSARRRKHKRIVREARGYFGTRSRHPQQAKITIMRALRYAWRDRRARKRDMRALWITRITAACRMRGTRYSLFMNGLRMAGINLNRKMLSQVAIEDPAAFDRLVEQGVRASRATPAKS
ncbi:MAG TPA: 50S ribosomal protein L20 [Phycisphaerales bacterium]|nr:50S ribosomal protein L20 [Phycisphaerales bacterium]